MYDFLEIWFSICGIVEGNYIMNVLYNFNYFKKEKKTIFFPCI